jgi:hypothetical protein
VTATNLDARVHAHNITDALCDQIFFVEVTSAECCRVNVVKEDGRTVTRTSLRQWAFVPPAATAWCLFWFRLQRARGPCWRVVSGDPR